MAKDELGIPSPGAWAVFWLPPSQELQLIVGPLILCSSGPHSALFNLGFCKKTLRGRHGKKCALTNGYRSILVGHESFISMKKSLLRKSKRHKSGQEVAQRWRIQTPPASPKRTGGGIIKNGGGFFWSLRLPTSCTA